MCMKYFSVNTLDELVKLSGKHNSNAVIVAGCTDAMVKKDFFTGKTAIIDTTKINELKKIEDLQDKIRIGAGVTFSMIKDSALIKQSAKALHQAAKVCGSVQIRNRATIAGNIINASPAADSVPALMTSNATLILFSENGEERISIKNFFFGPGKTILKPGQVLAYIELEKDKPEDITFYRKIGTRKALSIAKASIAFKANKANGKLKDVRIAFGSVGPTVIYSKQASNSLEGSELNNDTIEKASLAAFREVTPIDDIRSKAEYRKLVIKNALIEELKQFI